MDPARAAAKGLSPQDVVQAVLQSNVIVPAGSARLGTQQFDILLNSSPSTTEEFNSIPVRVINGVTVYLGEVAHVHDGFAVQTSITRINGKRSTYLAILKKANASTLAVIDAARDMIPMLKTEAPEAVEIRLDFDQSLFVRASIQGVLHEAIVSAALVSLMIFGFIGSWRSMIVVCISIPLAIMFGIVGLFLSGQTLNTMTLGGLALAIGMLVDDATVEVENINRNRMVYEHLTQAILEGTAGGRSGAGRDVDHLHRVLPGHSAQRAGAISVYPIGAFGRLLDARVVPPLSDPGANTGQYAASQ